jgi:predicted transcriptional regulator
MQTDILAKSLQKIGLSTLATNVYLELLNDNTNNISSLAKILRTHRPTIYKAVEELSELGLINSKTLVIEPPSRIVSIIRHQEIENKRIGDDLSEILPQFLNQYYETTKTSSVKIYEGRNNFVKMINECMEELEPNSEILWFCEGLELYEVIDSYYFNIELGSRRKKKNIKARVLASSNNTKVISKENKNDELDRQIKVLPKQCSSLGTIGVFGNRIVNFNIVLPRVIVMDDAVMARVYRDLFDVIWNGILD